MAKWTIPLDKFFGDAELSLNQQFRAIGLELLRNVVLLTPVDTGRLRGAWLFSIGARSDAGGEISFGDNRDQSEGPATQYALDAGVLAIAGATIEQSLFLQNNVEYGPYVNYGTERQAGQFFVEGAIAAVAG